MIDREEMTDVAFEMLKLLFFVVAYFLMASELGTSGDGIEKKITETAAFYNTLFIFSATTWIDYLSSMKDSIRDGYSYSGKYTYDVSICILGASIGFFNTFISLICVFLKQDSAFDYCGALVYWVSLVFIVMKAFVITDMVLHIKKAWSKKFSYLVYIPFIVMIIATIEFATGLLEYLNNERISLIFLVLVKKGMIPEVVIMSLMMGVLLCYWISLHNQNKIEKKNKETIKYIEEPTFLDIQNETDGKMPYDDLAFDWIVGKEYGIEDCSATAPEDSTCSYLKKLWSI